MWSACFSKIDLSYNVCHFIWFKPARKNAAVKKKFHRQQMSKDIRKERGMNFTKSGFCNTQRVTIATNNR